MQAFECTAALKTLEYALSGFVKTKHHCKVGIFTVAAILGDVGTCAEMVRTGGNGKWDKTLVGDAKGLAAAVEGKSIFDVGSLPLGMAQDIPLKYLFALKRAEVGKGSLEKADYKIIAGEFAKLVD